MSALLFNVLIKPLSHLPLSVLYILSDFLYILFFYVFKYRRKVVATNIENAFPNKSPEERFEIQKGFYQHLCDLIIESVRMISMPESEAVRRCHIQNPELMDKYYQKGQSVILVSGHYANWELACVAFPSQLKHKITLFYGKFNDEFSKNILLESRGKYGSGLLEVTEIKDFFQKSHSKPFGTVFFADQAPAFHIKKKLYWTEFLNQETPVALGVEKYALKYNLPVLYFKISKTSRGYYTVTFEEIATLPHARIPYEITDKHLRYLEKIILEEPQYWLWSHRRWKYKKPIPTKE